MSGYRTIVADPPWPHPDSGARTNPSGKASSWPPRTIGLRSIVPYDRMAVADIAALGIRDLAHPDGAHLYLWTTNRFLRDAYAVVEAWGFRPSTLLTWCKPPRGLGFGGAFVATTEFLLFARHGSLAPLRRWDSTWFAMGRTYAIGPVHSAKPEGFLDIVEQVSPGPRIELFARRARFGWDYAGDGSLGTVALPGLRAPGAGVSALDEHSVWPRLTDAQRADVKQVWEEIVTPALQDAQDTHRDATRVLLAAQDHRDAVSMFVRDATFAAARMPGHEPAYGCCSHGPDVGWVCGCRTRGGP